MHLHDFLRRTGFIIDAAFRGRGLGEQLNKTSENALPKVERCQPKVLGKLAAALTLSRSASGIGLGFEARRQAGIETSKPN